MGRTNSYQSLSRLRNKHQSIMYISQKDDNRQLGTTKTKLNNSNKYFVFFFVNVA